MRHGDHADMASMCAHNAQVADVQLQQARARLAKADDPSDEQREARYDVRKYLAERAHWLEYEAFYRRQAPSAQPASQRPTERKPPRLAVVPAPQPDRRLPRESEVDDEQI